ncbi:MAG: DoxX family protein [Steroidobacteraceae bacterium]|nr:DoxX family protein [Steroidobacteraceae bacterium]
MSKFGADRYSNAALLIARFMLVLLFLIFGWQKLTGFSGTEAYMTQVGAPLPWLATLIAIVMEFFVGIVLLLGVAVRPLALLMILYTFGTALIGHPYWALAGMDRFEAMIGFYKNISIMGGFLLLYVTGAGRYSVDGLLQHA